MIENKALQIKVIFKKYLETQKIGREHSKFPSIISESCSQKLFFENYFESIPK